MKSGNSLFISCKKAAEMIEMKQESALSMIGKLKLNIHKLNCKLCRNYERQSKLISKGLKRLFDLSNRQVTFISSPELKEKIKSNIPDA